VSGRSGHVRRTYQKNKPPLFQILGEGEPMKKLTIVSALALALVSGAAAAQQVAPGWTATGEWQCGPVRIITSTDGSGGLDFFVIGAWFDNHYTMQRGQLYYNGVPCMASGTPWPLLPRPRKHAQVNDDGEGEPK
jgi:hypothetical protein